MEIGIRKLDEVWSSDEKLFGLAQHIFMREEGADPDLLLYEGYLEVENYDLGEIFYVPLDFIASRDDKEEKVLVSATFTEALRQTWTRIPHFVARGAGRKEELLAD